MVDGGEAIKFKNKTTMPAFIKKELDDLKNINLWRNYEIIIPKGFNYKFINYWSSLSSLALALSSSLYNFPGNSLLTVYTRNASLGSNSGNFSGTSSVSSRSSLHNSASSTTLTDLFACGRLPDSTLLLSGLSNIFTVECWFFSVYDFLCCLSGHWRNEIYLLYWKN